jgi:alpha-amylase
LVDDTAFKSVGLDNSDLLGYYNTEEQGYRVKVFPISKHLRYSIPWHDVEKVISYLRSLASDDESRIAILGDDGEKFGVWPETYEHCWGNGWVDKFFSEVERNSDWLYMVPVGEYARIFPPRGRVYLPCASYDEMMEWSLPADVLWEYSCLKKRLEAEGRSDITKFMNSGFWRNFLVKYPEINRMHKKMLRVHHKVYQAKVRNQEDCGLMELWKAQCNCPYWHGVFGGVYLTDIRAVTYSNLIRAENKADNVLHQRRSWLECQKADFDGDGADELFIESDTFSIYISPEEGGSIFEWDIRNHCYNLLSTLARRPEAYHNVLADMPSDDVQSGDSVIPSIHDAVKVKDISVSSFLIYDKYPRSSLIDHFFASDTQLKTFADGSYQEMGDFIHSPYESWIKRRGKMGNVLLRRSGCIEIQYKRFPIEVQKEIKLVSSAKKITINYKIQNMSDMSVEVVFGSEWNINLLGGGHNEQAYYKSPGIYLEDSHLDSFGELLEIETIMLGNKNLDIELELVADRRVGLWRFPVESVSNSETGIEKIYQASCLVVLLPLKLSQGDAADLNLTWNVRSSS